MHPSVIASGSVPSPTLRSGSLSEQNGESLLSGNLYYHMRGRGDTGHFNVKGQMPVMQVKFRGLWRHTAWMSTPGVVWGPVREGFQQQSYKVLYPTSRLALYVTGPGREGSQ